ncbi:MAG: adenine-specific DNA-methyltransferase [Acidobacteriota bacterium]|nr:adenine-specific DNA-methyltransferase [Acidobacteriota bacterium]
MKITGSFDPDADAIIYEGDCLDLLSVIPSEFVQLIVTSPPYNIGKEYENRLILDDYLAQQRKVIEKCVSILKSTGSICWQVGNWVDNGAIIPLDILLYPIFASFGLKLRNRIIWHFGHGLHASKRFSGRYEVILWFTKTDQYTFNLDSIRVPQKYPTKKYFKGPHIGELSGNPLGKNPSDIWEIPNVKSNHVEKTIHPCQFPVELIERLVLSMTDENDWVFDPFMGVGSTAIASLMHKRRAIGAEIKREYNAITKERIAFAEKGELRVRPMERPVYDPNVKAKSIPPKTIELNREFAQPLLFIEYAHNDLHRESVK